jgi:hypothetical protein
VFRDKGTQLQITILRVKRRQNENEKKKYVLNILVSELNKDFKICYATKRKPQSHRVPDECSNTINNSEQLLNTENYSSAASSVLYSCDLSLVRGFHSLALAVTLCGR